MQEPDAAMPASSHNLCAKCGIRAASTHVCHGDAGKSVSLCDECLPKEDPLAAAFINEARNAKCQYCGGSPCSGGTNPFQHWHRADVAKRWMCMPCSTEYYTFIQRRLVNLSENLTQEDQNEMIRCAMDEVDSHLISYVAQRSN